MSDFTVKFWGVRGALPCSAPDQVEFGGNTACVEVRCAGKLIVLDAGSGLRNLGKHLLSLNRDIDFDLLLSHCHLDHVIGLPFFDPAYSDRASFRIRAGNLLPGTNVHDTVAQMMTPPLFPIMPEAFRARIDYSDFRAGEPLDLGGLEVATAPLFHPGGATGYRIPCGQTAIAYVTDNEHRPTGPDPQLVDLVRDVDLMIYDASYTPEEYDRRVGWGHSTWAEAVRLAEIAGVKRIALFHHDPSHDDDAMSAIEAQAQQAFPAAFAAREGMVVEL